MPLRFTMAIGPVHTGPNVIIISPWRKTRSAEVLLSGE